MEVFAPPRAMSFTSGNVAESWKRWVQKFHNFMLATEKTNRPEKVKIAILLNLLGDEGVEVYNTFHLETSPSLDDVLQCFEEHCIPRKNIVYERFKFFSCKQQEGQSFDAYLTQLKTLAGMCEFGEQEESLVRDRIVLGITDTSLQERMLREPSLTLKKAAQFVRAAEASKEQVRSMRMENEKESHIDVLQSRTRGQVKWRECKSCGRTHRKFQCPAYGKVCMNCGQKNHFAKCCNLKSINELEIKADELYY